MKKCSDFVPSRVVLTALTLCLGACGGADSTSSDGPATASVAFAGSAAQTDVTPEAIQDVTVALDTDRAISQDVPLAGGTVRATGADGTTYSLSIPSNALSQATRITLIPVAQISSMPKAKGTTTTLGVQMEPSGLKFMSPATLSIAPAEGAAIRTPEQIIVQWEGAGQHVTLAEADPSSTALKLTVHHFSGMGVLRSKAPIAVQR